MLLVAMMMAGQCDVAALTAVVVFDENAPMSVDVLEGAAPTNLVIFRESANTGVLLQVDRGDGTPEQLQPAQMANIERFEPQALTAEGTIVVTASEAVDTNGNGINARSVTLAVASGADDAEPTIDDDVLDVDANIQKGRAMCGPFAPDEHVYTVHMPAATDDVGVAAYQVRAVVNGEDRVVGGRVRGAGSTVFFDLFADTAESISVTALDHAGNTSAPVTNLDVGGCAQAGTGLPAALALVALGRARWWRRTRRA